MTTVRQIERLWTARQFDRLLRDLLGGRPEGLLGLDRKLRLIPAATAVAMIRLDELGQAHVPLFSRLVRTLLNTQDADGGWGDAMTTAICLRALMLGGGSGDSVRSGLAYLALLQKDNGAWPIVPIRRTDEDATTTAFVLYELAEMAEFREAVRFADAVQWLVRHDISLPVEARRLAHRATARARLHPLPQEATAMWS